MSLALTGNNEVPKLASILWGSQTRLHTLRFPNSSPYSHREQRLLAIVSINASGVTSNHSYVEMVRKHLTVTASQQFGELRVGGVFGDLIIAIIATSNVWHHDMWLMWLPAWCRFFRFVEFSLFSSAIRIIILWVYGKSLQQIEDMPKELWIFNVTFFWFKTALSYF